MMNYGQIAEKEQTLVKQARKVVTMRRKNAPWKELEPALNRMNATVRSIEKLERLIEQEEVAKPKTKRASA